MLEGWYCRNSRIANEQASQNHNQSDDNSSEEESQDGRNFNQVNYKSQYRYLKQKLKFLLYENEFFQDALRSSQRRLLKVSRDRSFLLDRLLQYEKPEGTSSESDETESSEEEPVKIEPKKRKLENNTTPGNSASKNHVGGAKKKKLMQPKGKPQNPQIPNVQTNHGHDDGHMMTAEEVERHLNHLQSRQIIELVPERAPPTVPTEMFSNEPSLDSESNDQLIETSPSNLGEDCLSVDMSIVKCEYKCE